MKMINIGIDAYKLSTWGGGIDFIATLAEAMEESPNVRTYLIVNEDTVFNHVYVRLKHLILSRFSIKKYKKAVKNELVDNSELLSVFEVVSPNTIPLFYKASSKLFFRNQEKRQLKLLKKNKIDIILPSYNCQNAQFSVPRIAYIYDFQHKYLKNLFSEDECIRRDKLFERQITNARYVIVNAESVRRDILKFYPKCKAEIIVLPFKPFQKLKMKSNINIEKYGLPKKYYMISNQFWMHKNHLLAFRALEKVYVSGIKDIHIVCSGKLEDVRNPHYIDELLDEISKLQCKNNIHLLGYIPKDDQLFIMKNSVGLIQPTLFEGGPGGGSVYNAICLGLTCLISDIDVNKEIMGYDNVFFFEKDNENELARLIVEHKDDEAVDDKTVEQLINRNKEEYSIFLLSMVKKVISENDSEVK